MGALWVMYMCAVYSVATLSAQVATDCIPVDVPPMDMLDWNKMTGNWYTTYEINRSDRPQGYVSKLIIEKTCTGYSGTIIKSDPRLDNECTAQYSTISIDDVTPARFSDTGGSSLVVVDTDYISYMLMYQCSNSQTGVPSICTRNEAIILQRCASEDLPDMKLEEWRSLINSACVNHTDFVRRLHGSINCVKVDDCCYTPNTSGANLASSSDMMMLLLLLFVCVSVPKLALFM